jgi:hypothetical protein
MYLREAELCLLQNRSNGVADLDRYRLLGVIWCDGWRGREVVGFPRPVSSESSEEAVMRYKPKSIPAPSKMRVEADPGIGVSAKTVGELRKLAAWPGNLVITVPQEQHRESVLKVSKANVATRTSPRPISSRNDHATIDGGSS